MRKRSCCRLTARSVAKRVPPKSISYETAIFATDPILHVFRGGGVEGRGEVWGMGGGGGVEEVERSNGGVGVERWAWGWRGGDVGGRIGVGGCGN